MTTGREWQTPDQIGQGYNGTDTKTPELQIILKDCAGRDQQVVCSVCLMLPSPSGYNTLSTTFTTDKIVPASKQLSVHQ